MSLKEWLASITKGESSVSNYLCSLRTIVDELAPIGHPVHNLDLIITTLNGLGLTFCEFYTSIRTRNSPYHWMISTISSLIMRFFYSGMGTNKPHFLALLIMPLVLKGVRSAIRLLLALAPLLHLCRSSTRGSPSCSNLIYQFCDKKGHTAKTCYHLHGYPLGHPKHQANSMQKDSSSEPTWLLDSGASYHATQDLANLSLANDYTGNDQLVVANGKGLPITHCGSASLQTSSSPLHLSNVLFVLDVSQNLISVSQLYQTNFVFVELFPWHF